MHQGLIIKTKEGYFASGFDHQNKRVLLLETSKRGRYFLYLLQDLDAVLPLALFLAHERNKGQGSFWQPYLGLLPENPGCAWLSL